MATRTRRKKPRRRTTVERVADQQRRAIENNAFEAGVAAERARREFESLIETLPTSLVVELIVGLTRLHENIGRPGIDEFMEDLVRRTHIEVQRTKPVERVGKVISMVEFLKARLAALETT